ncbi:MAG: hypothetical protein AB7S86_12030 [Hydrogenophaga sp.]|uniref:hypothetical protein n=1 Tax=Hydrogenophaga sp. TaxID=1904254 RepID=UPI003D1049AA
MRKRTITDVALALGMALCHPTGAWAAEPDTRQNLRLTPQDKLPPSFQALGEPTHLQLEDLAVRAESDDMDMLATQTGALMRQCMACHASFRVR